MNAVELKVDLKNVPGLGNLINRAAFTDAFIRIAGAQGLLPSHFGDVKEFHQKFGLLVGEQPRHLTRRKLKERIECMLEELTEFAEACDLSIGMSQTDSGDHKLSVIDMFGEDQDLPAQADALVDLVYFALGTAVMMGLPWQALWDDVQRANMTKVRGETKRGHRVDVTKPAGWVGPQGEDILEAHGYDRETYYLNHLSNVIEESKCHDDV